MAGWGILSADPGSSSSGTRALETKKVGAASSPRPALRTRALSCLGVASMSAAASTSMRLSVDERTRTIFDAPRLVSPCSARGVDARTSAPATPTARADASRTRASA